MKPTELCMSTKPPCITVPHPSSPARGEGRGGGGGSFAIFHLQIKDKPPSLSRHGVVLFLQPELRTFCREEESGRGPQQHNSGSEAAFYTLIMLLFCWMNINMVSCNCTFWADSSCLVIADPCCRVSGKRKKSYVQKWAQQALHGWISFQGLLDIDG
jgi:hypothetical protein